jgi:hypothetical protein
MSITIDDVEALKRELEELPRNQPRQVTKQEAVAMLATHLGSAKRRGYSPEDLAKILSARGIEINTATLRGYLRRNRKKRGRGRGEPRPVTKPSMTTPASSAPVASMAAATSAPPATRLEAVGQEPSRAPARSGPEAPSVKDAPPTAR